MDQIINQMDQKYFPKKGASLVVAVSGGVDSIGLLHVLMMMANQHDWNIIVAHFDHQLRKVSSKDEQFVGKVANNLGLTFISAKTDVATLAKKEKLTTEEAARKARYEFLNKVVSKNKAIIVTGHTADDQLETVLLNWIRGGGVRALAGMRSFDNNIWRPLLGITKQQMIDLAKEYNLKYVEDITNKENKFKRNLVRHKIIPILKLANPAIEQIFLRNAQIMAGVEDFINQETSRLYKKIAKKQQNLIWLDIADLNKLPDFLRNEVVLFAIQQLQGHQQDIKKAHLVEVQKIIDSNKTESWKQLPGKLFVSNRCGKIGFSRYRPKFLKQ